jgi:hypothetical protein
VPTIEPLSPETGLALHDRSMLPHF